MAVSKCINCKSLDAIQQWDLAIAKFTYADFIAFIECVENVVLLYIFIFIRPTFRPFHRSANFKAGET